MNEGDTVIAKHKNGRYYNCKVQEVRQQLFCEVQFEDGSYSNNMFPEDIEVLFIHYNALIPVLQPCLLP